MSDFGNVNCDIYCQYHDIVTMTFISSLRSQIKPRLVLELIIRQQKSAGSPLTSAESIGFIGRQNIFIVNEKYQEEKY